MKGYFSDVDISYKFAGESISATISVLTWIFLMYFYAFGRLPSMARHRGERSIAIIVLNAIRKRLIRLPCS